MTDLAAVDHGRSRSAPAAVTLALGALLAPDLGASCGDDAPIPTLPIVDVTDSVAPLGTYDQADIDDALERCQPGCNLRFLPETYEDVAMDIGSFPDGFAMFGAGQGATVLRAPLYGVTGPWDYMIDLPPGVPDGLVIQNMTLDGRKHEQLPPPAPDCASATQLISRTYAVHAGTGPTTRHDGTIRCLEIKDFLMIGVVLSDADGWQVADNWIHHMGCHDFDEPCGRAWSEWGCVVDTGPAFRRTNGNGIFLADRANHVEIANNLIEELSKFSIVIEGVGPKGDCSFPNFPKDNVIRDNFMRRGSGGVAINGACRTIIEDNTVLDSIATMNEDTPVGNGFECSEGGCEGLEMRRNVSRNNQAAGFAVRGNGSVVMEDNETANNCLGSEYNLGDVEIDGSSGIVLDATVTDHVATGATNCLAGIHVVAFAGAKVRGGSIFGGRFGIRVHNSHRVQVENILVQGGPGSESGMSFGTDLDRVYVQASARFSGFPEEQHFDEGSLNDGDSVAYCRYELVGPQPQCCKNLPGYDPQCDSMTACGPLPGFASATLDLGPASADPIVTLLSWPALPLAEAYDVVRGDLAALIDGHGAFAAATAGCVVDNRPVPTASFTGNPPPGEVFWFLVRGVYCGGNGTYDTGKPSQAGSRDAGIEASGNGCP